METLGTMEQLLVINGKLERISERLDRLEERVAKDAAEVRQLWSEIADLREWLKFISGKLVQGPSSEVTLLE